MPINTGVVIHDRYRIVNLLGQGGFGAVYRAWDTRLDRPCALKENTETSTDSQRQFEFEAKILSGLRHPNLPQVTDYFIVPGEGQYLVMNLVEGEDLQQMLDRLDGPLPESDAIRWIGQVCDALEYMHSQDPPVIHRDVKPDNIKITPEGKAVLVDFGIAKVYREDTDTTLGARAVTPGYSPQEQYGSGSTDARSDIYSLGATLYTILTNQEPPESIQRSLGETLVTPRTLNPEINSRTELAITKAMQLSPGNRFQTTAEFKADLTAPLTPAPETPTQDQFVPTGQSSTASSNPARGQQTGSPATLPKISRSQSVPMSYLAAGGAIGVLGICLVAAIAMRGIFPGAEVNPTATWTNTAVAVLPTKSFRPTATRVSIDVVLTGTSVKPAATSTATLSPIPPEPTIPPVTREPVESQVSDRDGMALVKVPAGEFLMGSSDADLAARPDESPQRTVDLDEFWIDQTEVTNAMYALCVQDGVCQPPNTSSLYGDPQYAEYPVAKVTWANAQSYCAWAGRRLPTEAEWEKAARGTEGELFPWGDTPPNGSLLNYCDRNCQDALNDDGEDDGYAGPAPVGSYPYGDSPYGVFDMAGNVWEWVADWYDSAYYSNAPLQNPPGPASGAYRVVRGSNWYSITQDLRLAIRYRYSPGEFLDRLGFRCAQ